MQILPGGDNMKSFMLLTVLAVASMTAAAATAAPASAQALVVRGAITNAGSDTGLTDGCHPGATGAIRGTDTFSYHSVEAPAGTFHFVATDVASGRIDWSDGSYTIIGSTDHSAFTTTGGTTTTTEAHVDFGDNYSADGVFLFHTTYHSTSHITVTNGDVVRVVFDFNHQHVFGSDCTP